MNQQPMTLLDIAERMMFAGMKESEILRDWEYRKGKGFEDIQKAVAKGSKLARHKAEREPKCIAIYLKDVLKKRRVAI